MKRKISKRVLSFILAFLMVIVAVPATIKEAEATSFTMLNQNDSTWKNYSYGGTSLSLTGSGIFALANAIGFVNGSQMSVTTVASWANDEGIYTSSGVDQAKFFSKASTKYGSTYSFSADCAEDGEGYFTDGGSAKLKAHLAKGYTAVVRVKDHFVALVGYDFDSNTYRVWDSAPSSLRGTTDGDVWVSAMTLLDSDYMCVEWYCLVSPTSSDSIPVKAAFDPMVYRYRNQDIAGIDKMTTAELKAHWLSTGIAEGRPSSVVLDLKYYKEKNSDLSNLTYTQAYNHFVKNGYKESRPFSETFMAWYYCDYNSDVNADVGVAGCLKHFIEYGIREDRRASSKFDANYYWHIRPDVERAWPGNYEMCVMHYAALGINEGIVAYDNQDPVISDIEITNVSTLGYTVSCKITDNWGLKNIAFPTWTVKNDQDDLFRDFFNTQQGTRDGDIYYFRVNSSDHNNETGQYITHIYATDLAGTRINVHCDIVNVTGSPSEQIVVSSDSSYLKEGVYIKNVKPDTTTNSFLNEFASSSLSVYDKNGIEMDGKAYVGTGSVLKLYKGSTLRDFMTLIVSGDANGDGEVNSTDFIMVKSAFLEIYTLESYQKLATDMDSNDKLNATDYMKIKEYLMFGKTDSGKAEKPSENFSDNIQIKESSGVTTVVTPENLIYKVSGYNSYSDNQFTINDNFIMKFGDAFPDNFNRMTLCYVASEPMQCVVTYRIGGEMVNDLFYLEAGKHTFSALIQGYLKGNKATLISTITVSTCEAVQGTFVLCDVKTEEIPVYKNDVYYIENNDYKLGAKLSWGGGISYIYDKNNRSEGLTNLVNQYDTGRLIQQSYYGADSNSDPSYVNGYFNKSEWPYNPVQGGDKMNNPSRIIDIVVGESSLYIKAQPMDWGQEGKITPSYMENVYILQDGLIRVDNRFVDFSGMKHRSVHQELPAFYTVSYLDTFSYYAGSKPWTDDTLTSHFNLPFWGGQYHNDCEFKMKQSNTETWCAWINRNSTYGIGLYVPNIDVFLAGRSSYNGSKDPNNAGTAYVAPLNQMLLVSYRPVEYSYLMTTGKLDDIRKIFKENKDFETNESMREFCENYRLPD